MSLHYIHAFEYTYTYTYTYIDTYMTLHYITLHSLTSHYITLHSITLHYSTVHYITLHYITLHYITLHYITLHYIHYIHYGTYVHTYVHLYTYCAYVINTECTYLIYVYLYIRMQSPLSMRLQALPLLHLAPGPDLPGAAQPGSVADLVGGIAWAASDMFKGGGVCIYVYTYV